MVPDGSLPCLQDPSNCPYCEPDQSSSCPHSHLMNIHLNIILPSSLPYIQPFVRASGLRGFVFYFTLGHVGGGNSCGEDTQLRVTMVQAG